MSSSDSSDRGSFFRSSANKFPSITDAFVTTFKPEKEFRRMRSLPNFPVVKPPFSQTSNIFESIRGSGDRDRAIHSMLRVSQRDFSVVKPPFSQTSDIVESRVGGDRDRDRDRDIHSCTFRVFQRDSSSSSCSAAFPADFSFSPPADFSFSPPTTTDSFPPGSVFGPSGEKELEDIETTRRALAAMWPKIAHDKQMPNPKRKQKPYLLSKTDAEFAAKVAVAVAEVAAADAADAADKAAKAASAVAAASSAADKAAATAADAAGAAFYANSAFATATRFEEEELNPETEPPLDDDDDDDDVPIAFLEKACKALEYYKDTKGDEFELVEIVQFEAALLPPYYANHINFTAKLKHVSDSCSKLFFAEIYERFGREGEGHYEVSMCMILDPASQDVMKGCGYNQGVDMLHPRGVKFWQGPPSGTPEWDEQIRSRRSSVGAH